MKTKYHKLTATALIAAVLCLIISSVMYAKTKDIYIKTDEDRSGYNDVRETHDIDNGNEYHQLFCNDPGLSLCQWQYNPCGRLIEYAKDQIEIGILSGQHQIQENFITYTVTWGNTENGDSFIKEVQTINEPLN